MNNPWGAQTREGHSAIFSGHPSWGLGLFIGYLLAVSQVAWAVVALN